MPDTLPDRLLVWYDRDARTLPWRGLTDPYAVWLSEVMLQQTTVAAVIPYFARFLARWPTVQSLAAAPTDAVMAEWAGLGYYARARNLIACAKLVTQWRNGRFPEDEAGLRQLPGVGDYTAAAIAAIAFGQKAVVVDGNVERVMTRLHAVQEPLPKAKPRLKQLAAALTPDLRAGDYAQAVMDLGATICTPRKPACGICPWQEPCEGRRLGIAERLPAKLEKPARPIRFGTAFWLTDSKGRVLLRRRPPQGLLGGMMEIPSTEWSETQPADPTAQAPITADWRALPGEVRHIFTHFQLNLRIMAAKAGPGGRPSGLWVELDRLGEHALPTVMRKLVRDALAKAY
ncbi:MAG: A/G-specific adenine glycosylase [Alphaproteobacteria bacterium]|nr:A/G-specific adenine glycosylase [Alphaproteobacteria bacterium]